MKRNFQIVLLLFFVFTFSRQLFAQDEKSDAVYLSLTKEYTLNPDGSMDYRYAKEQKLQTYRSFHSLYGETFIVYNPTEQQLRFNEVFTVMADGKKVITPKNAFNEVLPGFAANAPAYNTLREMVITHTGLERNSTINLDYTIHSSKGSFPSLSGNELLAETEPVKTLVLRIRIPMDKELYYQVFNAEFPPTKTREGIWQVFTWNLKDLPALSAEEAQESGNSHYPRLIFSTIGNRNGAFPFLTTQPAFGYAATDAMKSELALWTKDIKDKFDIMLKIQEKVVGDFRLIPVPLRYAGYRSRTAEQVWNSNSGTSLEKTLLLTTLLKSAGIDATPFAIVNASFFEEKIGTLTDIEDFGVKVVLKEEGTIWISATTLNPVCLKSSVPSKVFITLDPAAKPVILKTGTTNFYATLMGTFLVSSDPILTGEISISLRGTAYPWLGVSRDKNKIKNGLSGSLSGSALTGIKESSITAEALFQTLSVTAEKPFRKDSNYYYLTLPSIGTGVDGWGIKTLSIRRETPFELPAPVDENYQLTFSLPSGMTIFTPAKKTEYSNKAGSFSFEIKQAEGKIIVKRQLKIDKRLITVDNYADLKVLMDAWNNPRYRELVFTTAK